MEISTTKMRYGGFMCKRCAGRKRQQLGWLGLLDKDEQKLRGRAAVIKPSARHETIAPVPC
jgi:hypothetical protein